MDKYEIPKNKRRKEKKGSMRSIEKLFIGKKARVGRREREACGKHFFLFSNS